MCSSRVPIYLCPQFNLDINAQTRDQFDSSTTPPFARNLYTLNPSLLTDPSQPDGICIGNCVTMTGYAAGSLVATWRVLLPDGTSADAISTFMVSRMLWLTCLFPSGLTCEIAPWYACPLCMSATTACKTADKQNLCVILPCVHLQAQVRAIDPKALFAGSPYANAATGVSVSDVNSGSGE